jgi:anti-anti-sigma factor
MTVADATLPGHCGLDPVLEVWVDRSSRPTRVTLAGRLDGATGRHVRSLLHDLAAAGYRTIVVDLQRTFRVGNDGLDLLVEAARRASHAGGAIRLIEAGTG